HERQSQARIARASVKAGLAHLTIAGFDAEAATIVLADFGRRTMHTPSGEQQFLFDLLAVFAVSMPAVSHAHRNGDLLFAALHGVRVPTGALPLDPAQSRRRAALLWLSPAN